MWTISTECYETSVVSIGGGAEQAFHITCRTSADAIDLAGKLDKLIRRYAAAEWLEQQGRD